MVRGAGLPGFLAAAPSLPKVLYRGHVHCGLQAVNSVLRRAGNGIAPLPLKRVAALEDLGDLAARDDAEIVAAMAVHRYEFEDMARELGGRELGTPAAALSLRTHGRSTKPGHPGDYPKGEDSVQGLSSMLAPFPKWDADDTRISEPLKHQSLSHDGGNGGPI